MKTGILGGGLTGLTLSYLLRQNGYDSEILEKESNLGGLMRTLRQDGFEFDLSGSHIIFSKNKEVLDFLVDLLGDNKVEQKRNTKVLYKGSYIKYPFENGLASLSKQENFECLCAFIENQIAKEKGITPKPTNLKEWFYYTFGSAIAEKYLAPYNQKIWKHPLENLTLEWVERVPNPPIIDILKSSLGIETEGYVHQSYFFYPLKGGIQAIIESLKEKVGESTFTDFKVQKIRKEDDLWVVSNGKQERFYNKLVSTMPIQALIEALDAPKEVKIAVNDLKFNSLITIMLGLNTSKINDLSWLYLPDKNSLSHRVSFPSNYSPYVVPSGKSSILAEITCINGGEIWKMNDEEIILQTINDLHQLQIIDKEDVCFAKAERSAYAYVLTDMKYSENLKIVNNFTEQLGIDLLGRFSEFKYINMDACVENVINYMGKFKQIYCCR